jgi:chromosome segregation ATPase
MEMEPSWQQMMACLLAEIQAGQAELKAIQEEMKTNQAEIKSDINAKIEAGQEEVKARKEKVDAEANVCQDKADSEAKARQDQLKQGINGHMEELRPCGHSMTTCQVPSVVYPDNSKASPE